MMRDWPELVGVRSTRQPESSEKSYVLNAYDSAGNLDKAIWISEDQYRAVKETLLEQGCEVEDGAPKAKGAAE